MSRPLKRSNELRQRAEIYLSPAERELAQAKADEAGLTLSSFARESLLSRRIAQAPTVSAQRQRRSARVDSASAWRSSGTAPRVARRSKVIAKLVKGGGFRGVLGYLLEGPKGARREHSRVITTNMAGDTPRELSQEFGVLRRLRPSLGKAVCHASISLAPEDRSLTDEEFSFIAKKFLAGMGFDDCPYIAVRHEDTTHQHIHVLVSRITTAGEVVSDKNDFTRAEKIMRELEQVYMLRAPTNFPQQGKATR